MSPPVPEKMVGDHVVVFLREMGDEIEEGSLRKLAKKLREEKEELLGNFMKKERALEMVTGALQKMAETVGRLMNGEGVELYSSSSWCEFPIYKADFGWGMPIWGSFVSLAFKNTIIMINKRDDNWMKVWWTLAEDHVAVLDGDEELHRFASVSPGIVW